MTISMEKLRNSAEKIKLVIFDVDGVLTDGSLYLMDTGIHIKAFHCHDGVGIKLLQQGNIHVGIITAHQSELITKRMQQLGLLHVYQGQQQKMPAYEDLQSTLQLPDEQIAYVGDDLPDLPLIRRAGLGITVSNATAFIKEHADWITNAEGGRGAAREICEYILHAQNKLVPLLNEY